MPIVLSSREGATILRPYQSVIQVKRSDFGMMDGRKVYAMEHSIFDALKETECCRVFAEYCVRWVRVAGLGASAAIGIQNIYSFLPRMWMQKQLLLEVSSCYRPRSPPPPFVSEHGWNWRVSMPLKCLLV